MKNLASYIKESKQKSVKSFTSREAYDLVNSLEEPLKYVKSVEAQMDKIQFAQQKELDKKMMADPNFDYYDEFDKLIAEIDKKYKTEKFNKYNEFIKNTYAEMELGMTPAEIKKLPRRGGYRMNLTKAFLNKYTNDTF